MLSRHASHLSLGAVLLLGTAVFLGACSSELRGGFNPPPTPPLIALSDSSVLFDGTTGGADPALQSVNVIHFGGGDLDSLTIGSVTYGAGQPSGWLVVGLAGSPPIISVQPSTAGLPSGTYAATITLQHPSASNTPLSLSVGLEVSDAPIISLASNQFRFGTVFNGSLPLAPQVGIFNSAPGTLSGLSLGQISYAAGQPTGWLTASLGAQVAPTTLTVRPNTTALAAGTYVASVPVLSAGAANSPVAVAVAYVVDPDAIISATPSSLTLNAVGGGPSPAAVTTAISNAGGGSLVGLKVEPITFGLGASNWVTATLSGTTAPATLTVTPTTSAVLPGTYSASIPISSTDPLVDTISVRVSLTVSTPPAIGFSAQGLSFTGITAGTTPPSQSILVTNKGPGVLAGLSVGAISYGAGATGWLSASISGSVSPATVTVVPSIAGLAAGTYTAAIPVSSSTAGVTTANLNVTLTLSAAVPGGIVKLGGDNQTNYVGNTLTPLSVRVLTANNLPIVGAPVTWTVNNGGSISVVNGITNATGDASTIWTLGPNPGTQTVTAQTPGVPSLVFTATAQPRVTAGYPNEPAGYTKITERAFDAKVEQGWNDRGDVNFTIASDAAAPRSPTNIGSALFALGRAGGTGPILTGRSLTTAGNFTSIYISFWMKVSANWDGHTSHVNKIHHIWINGGNKVYLSAQGSDAGPLQPQVRLQGIPGPVISRNLQPNVANLQIQRGNWHRWELVLTSNTVGNADGKVEWWIDGVRVGSYTDVQVTDNNRFWSELDWNPTWGGLGDVVPANQYMYMDHIYISGKP